VALPLLSQNTALPRESRWLIAYATRAAQILRVTDLPEWLPAGRAEISALPGPFADTPLLAPGFWLLAPFPLHLPPMTPDSLLLGMRGLN